MDVSNRNCHIHFYRYRRLHPALGKDPEAMKATLAKHDAISSGVIKSINGYIIKITGDGVHTVFTTYSDSINAALWAKG